MLLAAFTADVRLLTVFVAVAETLSRTKAAARLHIDPSTAGKMLRQLEQQHGRQLVVSTTRVSSLTPAGRALLPVARDAVEAAARAQTAVRSGQAGSGRVLHLP